MEQFTEQYQEEQRNRVTQILIHLARLNPSYLNTTSVWTFMDWDPKEVTSQEHQYLEEMWRTLRKMQSMWSKYVAKDIKAIKYAD